MSIITTVYTETLTITTDDAGRVTMERHHTADTDTAYYFTELSEEAQNRAISDAIKEEASNYYGSHSYFEETEIWDAARDLEKQQPIEFDTDQGGSPYATARGASPWCHHAASWEAVTEATNDGTCYSMDICDKWNEYAARIVALQEMHEVITDIAWKHDEAADEAGEALSSRDDDTPQEVVDILNNVIEHERESAAFYERMAYSIEDAAEELTEEAARAVGDIVDSLIEAQRDYYTSPEFWREWYSDGDERFTRDGKLI